MRKQDDIHNLRAQHEPVDITKESDPELDIIAEELTWSPDNVDTELLNQAYTRACDYIINNHEKFAVREDIDANTARPTIYLDSEETGKTIEIPLTTLESTNWDLFDLEIKNAIAEYKKKYGEKPGGDNNDPYSKLAA